MAAPQHHKAEPLANSLSVTTEREHWLAVACYFGGTQLANNFSSIIPGD